MVTFSGERLLVLQGYRAHKALSEFLARIMANYLSTLFPLIRRPSGAQFQRKLALSSQCLRRWLALFVHSN